MHDEFTSRLGLAFEASKLTQQGLADRLGVSQSTISHWLTGRRRPTFRRVEGIARELSVDAAFLAFGTPSPRPSTARARGSARNPHETRAAS